MKTIFAIALCMGLAFATLTIPLQSKAIYYRDANSVDQLVDEVLYADSDFVHQTHNEDVVLDVQAKVNYLISRNTKLNQNAVNPNAFDCTAQCEQGEKQTGTFPILGGKVNVSGGVFLKGNTAVEVTDSNDEVEVELKVYVPETVESSTAPQENKILQSFNAGLSLARTDSFITALESSSKLVHHNQFSLYVHDKIAQLNVGGIQEYFVEPESPVVHVATNHSKGWSVTISGIKTKNGSLLKKDGQKIVAHWDLTSKYIFVPHIEAVNYINYVDPAHYYFMTSKELLCFQPSNNLGNQYSYVCSAEKFPGFEAFNDITFTFVGLDEKDIHVVLRPTDYISQQADGSYELLFRFSTSPQSINDFYFGTSFFNKFYATFNSDKGVITLRDKYTVDVPVNGWHLDDNYRIPVIVVGLVLALAAVIILLVILKRVKLEDPAGQIPMYSVYKPAVPVYQTGVNVSGFQPTVATSVYNPAAQNAVVSSQQLRQSQTQVRQSQTMVRNSQNYVRNY